MKHENVVNVRLTDEEYAKLLACAEYLDVNMSDVIRNGIEIQYAYLTGKEN